MTNETAPPPATETLYTTKYLELRARGRWHYVHRPGITGVAVLVPLTDDNRVVFTEQHRLPLDKNVIELPAGLAGDIDEHRHEPLAQAAHRELLEETGYDAAKITELTAGPPSAGLSDEIITFFLAQGLRRVHAGGGDETENITVHEIPLDQCRTWLKEIETAGEKLVDPKVYTGLYFLLHP